MVRTLDTDRTILIVDDDRNTRESLGRALQRDGYTVLTAETGNAALTLAQDHDLDLVLTDLKMPGLDGLGFLEGLRVVQPDVSAILISAFASVDTAVKAVRRGVCDVLEKPIRLRDVRRAIKRAISERPKVASDASRSVNRGADDANGANGGKNGGSNGHGAPSASRKPLIGASPSFCSVLDVIERVAPVSSTVLLLGESGTGKELLTEEIHAQSERANGPLIKVACAALAEGVLESELFGNEKGAYTGAHEQRKGRFELAHGGTLFLDEIGELSLPLQVKLLRVLQEGEFERVGGSETIRTDVRVIAATNRDLEAEVREGRFREDLYWRLNVISIHVPPLRERPGDVILLADHYLAKVLEATGRDGPKSMDESVIRAIQVYNWPGNVRELENAIERAVVLARGDVLVPADLPRAIQDYVGNEDVPAPEVIPFRVGQRLSTLEREAIRQTLLAVGGNREAAASILGIGKATLYRRLREMEADAAKEAERKAAEEGAEPGESGEGPTDAQPRP